MLTDQGAVTHHLIRAGYLCQTMPCMRLPALPSASHFCGADSEACVLGHHLTVACYCCGYLSLAAFELMDALQRLTQLLQCFC